MKQGNPEEQVTLFNSNVKGSESEELNTEQPEKYLYSVVNKKGDDETLQDQKL